jgi:hypothetical protein
MYLHPVVLLGFEKTSRNIYQNLAAGANYLRLDGNRRYLSELAGVAEMTPWA